MENLINNEGYEPTDADVIIVIKEQLKDSGYEIIENPNLKVGDILEVKYSDGIGTVKIIYLGIDFKLVVKNDIGVVSENDIAICEFSPKEISKIKIKGVWLNYQVLS